MIKAVEKSDKLFSFMYKDTELYYYNGGRRHGIHILIQGFTQFQKIQEEIKSLGHLIFFK